MHPLASLSQELGPPYCSIIDDTGARNRNEQASLNPESGHLRAKLPQLSILSKVDSVNIYLESYFEN